MTNKPLNLKTKKIHLRKMKISDLGKVLKIERESFPTPWSEASFKTEIIGKSISFPIVGLIGRKMVGYGVPWIIFEELHIANIAVNKEFRGLGIGDKLLRAMHYMGYFKGVTHSLLEVRKSNTIAQKLYFKYGYEMIGIRENYYQNENEDAIVLSKKITGPPDISDLDFWE